MSDELNALTQRLYAQGYTRENHPDTVCWGDWHNFSYKWETIPFEEFLRKAQPGQRYYFGAVFYYQ